VSYLEDVKRWKQSVAMARDLGMPEPAPPDKPAPKLKKKQGGKRFKGGKKRKARKGEKTPTGASRTSRPKAKSDMDSFRRALQGIYDKTITGAALPNPNMIPYAQMPTAVRKLLPYDAPPIGWNPDQLDEAETDLLERLMALSEREREVRDLTPDQEVELARRMQSTEQSLMQDERRHRAAKPWGG
jgi:hypothetical protein